MLAFTLAVQWLLPWLGWRGLFTAVAVCLVLAMAGVAMLVPRDTAHAHGAPQQSVGLAGHGPVFRQPAFIRAAPLGVFAYVGLAAMQALWIGPWLNHVGGCSAVQAAQGLFAVNLSMLVALLCWGLAMPRLNRAGWAGERLIAVPWPLGVGMLLVIVWQAEQAAVWIWTLWCVCPRVVSLARPVLAQRFPAALAGRALSAFNLVIVAGVFVLQWGIGLGIDAMRTAGLGVVTGYQLAFGAYALATAPSFLWRHGCYRWQRTAVSTQPARG